MTKNNLTKGLCAALLLASPLVGADSRYPAADFQPTIITQDAALIAKHAQAANQRANEKATPSQSASTETSSADASIDNTDKPSSNKEEASMENYPIALVVLALAGFVFWNSKRSGAKSNSAQEEAPRLFSGTVGGETGVAKYLKNVTESAKTVAVVTGVAKYLEEVEAAAKKAAGTGVSRYVKAVEAEQKAKPAETGVAKYLKGMDR